MELGKKLRRVKGRQRGFSGRCLQRVAIVSLLMLAWSWVFILLGMVLYHGHFHQDSSHSHVFSVQEALRGRGGSSAVVAVQDKTPRGKKPGTKLQPHESPLLIFTCNRENYLEETLTDIKNYIPADCSIGCPIVISQDGSNPKVAAVIERFTASFAEMNIPLVHLKHQSSLRKGSQNSYQALAVHYGWALKQVFGNSAEDSIMSVSPQRVLILEEDIHIAPDFFSYFAALAPLLDQDKTLLAVSAFNDNGARSQVHDNKRILRSDFFPGLGWMMNRRLWDTELSLKWPTGYWDDWLREPAQRQDRHILHPEVSRTFHFGVKGGASSNQFGNRLSQIYLNDDPIDWSKLQSQLTSQLQVDRYNSDYLRRIKDAKLVSSFEAVNQANLEGDVRIEYNSWKHFQQLARKLKLMDDEKAGIPRTGYKGVVETFLDGEHAVFLTPPIEELEKAFSEATAQDNSHR